MRFITPRKAPQRGRQNTLQTTGGQAEHPEKLRNGASRTQTGTIVNQRGSALIVIALIVTLLVAVTVEFAYEVFIGVSALSNWSSAQKASLVAKSGQALSSAYLKEADDLNYTYPGEVDMPIERDFGPGTSLSVKIQDETSKFNINTIVMMNGLTNEEALASLQKLFEYLNINPFLAVTIADWIDPDENPRRKTSELNAKNAPLWSVDELKLIDGIDKKTFNTISPYITVFGQRNVRKTNINTAKLPVLVSLHRDMTEMLAERIINYRENTPFEFEGQIQNLTGMATIGQELQGKITVKSDKFRITSTAEVNGVIRTIESVMNKSMMIEYWREG